MKILGQVFFMYGIAALISFFVAFLIQAIFVVLNKFEKDKTQSNEAEELPTISLKSVQKEATMLGSEGEVFAAISLAMHLYLKEIHDDEDLKMTIQKTVRPYSPWSSKIYSVTPWRR